MGRKKKKGKEATNRWSSRIAFLIAAIGSAVGLGNYWRFPYIAGSNGGGGFLIVYMICLILFGIPLMLLEISLGKRFRLSVYELLSRHNIRWLIIIPMFMSLMVLSFYTVIVGWTLSYAFISITSWDNLPVFNEFVAGYDSLIFFTVVLVIAALPVALGVRGIERFVKAILPTMLVLTIFILGYMLTLPNSLEGIRFLLTPDFSSVTDIQTWLIATAQVMFSLSVGVGILLTYSAYSKRSNPVVDTIAISLSDLGVALLSGLMVFSAVYAFGLDVAEGPELAFVTMPHVFNAIAYGSVLALIFYIILFIAGITSVISILEFLYNNTNAITGTKRTTIIPLTVAVVFILGAPVALSYTPLNFRLGSRTYLELYDHLFVNLTAPIVILIITGIGLLWKYDDFIAYLKDYIGHNPARVLVLWIKIAIPIVGLILFYQAVNNIIYGW